MIGKAKEVIQAVGEKVEQTTGLQPIASVTGVNISKIDIESADIVFDVLVKNITLLSVPLANINYSAESDGKKLVSGSITDAGTIDALGEETVKITVSFIYDDIKNAFADIKPGSIIPYEMKIELVVDVKIFGKLTLSLEKTGEIPIPSQPEINLEKIQFEKFSLEESVAVFYLKMENNNQFELELKSMECEFWLSDSSIGSAQLSESTKIDKSGTSNINISITFKPKDFGTALWNTIQNQDIQYTVKGQIEADTSFGVMTLPLSKEGDTTLYK